MSVIEMARSRWHLAPEHSNLVNRLVSLEFEAMATKLDGPRLLRGALAPLLAFQDEGLEVNLVCSYLGEDIIL